MTGSIRDYFPFKIPDSGNISSPIVATVWTRVAFGLHSITENHLNHSLDEMVKTYGKTESK